jgi:triphosphatase
MTDTGAPTEIELTLRLAPDAVPKLLRSPLVRELRRGRANRQRLISTYFDTADFRLMKHRVALRVRKIGERRIQTIKMAPSSDTGVLARREWERELEADQPDLSNVDDRELRKLMAGSRFESQLKALFVTDIQRATLPLTINGSTIELALDVGSIKSERGTVPVCEAELELKSGDVDGVYALARELNKAFPCIIEPMSKAQRGYALVSESPPPARRAERLRFPHEITVGEAFVRIGRNGLLQLRANEASLRALPTPEGIHQFRVAVRRLRSALSAFRRVLDPQSRQRVAKDLRWIAKQCGAAREWDVFRSNFLKPLRAQLPQEPALRSFANEVDAAQKAAYKKVMTMLASPRYTDAVLRIEAWWESHAGTSGLGLDEAAGDFAHSALKKLHRKLLKAGEKISELDEASLHEVRIRGKKLRYMSEFFASLYPRKLTKTYLAALADIQDHLGSLNDGAVVRHLLHDIEKRAPDVDAAVMLRATGLITGWSSARIDSDLQGLPEAWAGFVAAKPFWKKN